MICKTIERLILEREDRPLDENERKTLEAHLRRCLGCRTFEAGRRVLRGALMDLAPAELPQTLDLRTRRLCLEASGAVPAARHEAQGRRKIPLPVVAASVLFTILTAIWLTATLGDVTPGEPLPSGAWGGVVLIAQNVLMLFLAPILFRGARSSENGRQSFR